jgi:hypothetical protein
MTFRRLARRFAKDIGARLLLWNPRATCVQDAAVHTQRQSAHAVIG